MRERIITTTLAKPAKLKYEHPVGTLVSLIDKYTETKTGRQTFFFAPKVDGMYLERADEFIRIALSKRTAALASRKLTNPKDPLQGESFADKDSILDFFEYSSAAITLLHAAVEFTANRFIEQAKELQYRRSEYMTFLKFGNIRFQIRRETTLSLEEVLRLPLEEKLKSVLPAHYAFEPPSSKIFWQKFTLLKTLRDKLLHITHYQSYGASRGENSVFAKLLEVDLKDLLTQAEALIRYIEQKCQQTEQ